MKGEGRVILLKDWQRTVAHCTQLVFAWPRVFVAYNCVLYSTVLLIIEVNMLITQSELAIVKPLLTLKALLHSVFIISIDLLCVDVGESVLGLLH